MLCLRSPETDKKSEEIQFLALFQRVKKVTDFFARFKYATFFVKLTLHEKSRFARQKVLTDVFDGYNPT